MLQADLMQRADLCSGQNSVTSPPCRQPTLLPAWKIASSQALRNHQAIELPEDHKQVFWQQFCTLPLLRCASQDLSSPATRFLTATVSGTVFRHRAWLPDAAEMANCWQMNGIQDDLPQLHRYDWTRS